MAALVFTRARYTGGPVALVFGATGGTVPPEVSAATAVGTTVLGGVQAQGLALYNNRTPLRASTSASLRHQQARPAGAQAANASGPALPSGWQGGAAWTPASASGQRFAAPWLGTDPRAGQSAARHQQAFATAAGWLVVAEDEKAFEEAMERALLLPEAEFQAMQVAARAAVAHNGLDEGVRRFTEASRDVLEHWRARMPGSAAWESSL